MRLLCALVAAVVVAVGFVVALTLHDNSTGVVRFGEPDQIAVANEVFAPSKEALALAERQVAAFEQAQGRGEGVAVVDGRIVENLHVATARQLLARAAAIAALEAGR